MPTCGGSQGAPKPVRLGDGTEAGVVGSALDLTDEPVDDPVHVELVRLHSRLPGLPMGTAARCRRERTARSSPARPRYPDRTVSRRSRRRSPGEAVANLTRFRRTVALRASRTTVRFRFHAPGLRCNGASGIGPLPTDFRSR